MSFITRGENAVSLANLSSNSQESELSTQGGFTSIGDVHFRLRVSSHPMRNCLDPKYSPLHIGLEVQAGQGSNRSSLYNIHIGFYYNQEERLWCLFYWDNTNDLCLDYCKSKLRRILKRAYSKIKSWLRSSLDALASATRSVIYFIAALVAAMLLHNQGAFS